ncbi:MAG: LytTR family transcriptional regulator DNA-binding domain-containing protein, partial [Flammeovirgaceae bacterium]
IFNKQVRKFIPLKNHFHLSMNFAWLHKPYPLLSSTRSKTLLVCGFSLFTYIFLLIYQPFGAAEISDGQPLFLAGFGLNVLLALSFNYFLLPVLFKSLFNPETWQIKKELIYILWSFLLISTLNYAYNSSVGRDIAPQHSLLGFIGITFSIGVFPLLIQIYLTEKFLFKQNQLAAEKLSQKRPKTVASPSSKKRFSIIPETVNAPSLSLNLASFLFATSDNNYTTVFYLEEDRVQQQLLRISLKKVEQQLNEFPELIRCHRSYLVNKLQIEQVIGNARSLNLQLKAYPQTIPVSRSFPKEALV